MPASSAPLKRPDWIALVQAAIAASPSWAKQRSPLSSCRTSANAVRANAPAVTSAATLNAMRFIVLVPGYASAYGRTPAGDDETNWLISYEEVLPGISTRFPGPVSQFDAPIGDITRSPRWRAPTASAALRCRAPLRS